MDVCIYGSFIFTALYILLLGINFVSIILCYEQCWFEHLGAHVYEFLYNTGGQHKAGGPNLAFHRVLSCL